jgi:hypothetical protein
VVVVVVSSAVLQSLSVSRTHPIRRRLLALAALCAPCWLLLAPAASGWFLLAPAAVAGDLALLGQAESRLLI